MDTTFYDELKNRKNVLVARESVENEEDDDYVLPDIHPDPLMGLLEAKLLAPAEARKDDEGKARFDLIPTEALEGLAWLYAMGAKKYEDRNWEKGLEYSRVYAAMERHARKWFRGETYDGKDGQHHLLSVMWCAMALYTYEIRGTGKDDRVKSELTTEDIESFWRCGPSYELGTTIEERRNFHE